MVKNPLKLQWKFNRKVSNSTASFRFTQIWSNRDPITGIIQIQ